MRSWAWAACTVIALNATGCSTAPDQAESAAGSTITIGSSVIRRPTDTIYGRFVVDDSGPPFKYIKYELCPRRSTSGVCSEMQSLLIDDGLTVMAHAPRPFGQYPSVSEKPSSTRPLAEALVKYDRSDLYADSKASEIRDYAILRLHLINSTIHTTGRNWPLLVCDKLHDSLVMRCQISFRVNELLIEVNWGQSDRTPLDQAKLWQIASIADKSFRDLILPK